MADAFRIMGTQTTEEIDPSSLDISPVTTVTVQALPSGVTFPVRLAGDSPTPDQVHAAAEPLAETLNTLAARKDVAKVAVAEAPDSTGSYVDTVTITVQTANGKSTAPVSLPLDGLDLKAATTAIGAATDRLAAIEAL